MTSTLTVGDACRSVYAVDGLEYEAKIVSIEQIHGNKRTVIEYVGYGNRDSKWIADLTPSRGQDAIAMQLRAATAAEEGLAHRDAHPKWKTGDACKAKYSKDGVECVVEIVAIKSTEAGDEYATVVAVDGGTVENIWIDELVSLGLETLNVPSSSDVVSGSSGAASSTGQISKDGKKNWKVHSKCRAPSTVNSTKSLYEGVVQRVYVSSGGEDVCVVRFFGYEDAKYDATVPVAELEKSAGREARLAQLTRAEALRRLEQEAAEVINNLIYDKRVVKAGDAAGASGADVANQLLLLRDSSPPPPRPPKSHSHAIRSDVATTDNCDGDDLSSSDKVQLEACLPPSLESAEAPPKKIAVDCSSPPPPRLLSDAAAAALASGTAQNEGPATSVAAAGDGSPLPPPPLEAKATASKANEKYPSNTVQGVEGTIAEFTDKMKSLARTVDLMKAEIKTLRQKNIDFESEIKAKDAHEKLAKKKFAEAEEQIKILRGQIMKDEKALEDEQRGYQTAMNEAVERERLKDDDISALRMEVAEYERLALQDTAPQWGENPRALRKALETSAEDERNLLKAKNESLEKSVEVMEEQLVLAQTRLQELQPDQTRLQELELEQTRLQEPQPDETRLQELEQTRLQELKVDLTEIGDEELRELRQKIESRERAAFNADGGGGSGAVPQMPGDNGVAAVAYADKCNGLVSNFLQLTIDSGKLLKRIAKLQDENAELKEQLRKTKSSHSVDSFSTMKEFNTLELGGLRPPPSIGAGMDGRPAAAALDLHRGPSVPAAAAAAAVPTSSPPNPGLRPGTGAAGARSHWPPTPHERHLLGHLLPTSSGDAPYFTRFGAEFSPPPQPSSKAEFSTSSPMSPQPSSKAEFSTSSPMSPQPSSKAEFSTSSPMSPQPDQRRPSKWAPLRKPHSKNCGISEM